MFDANGPFSRPKSLEEAQRLLGARARIASVQWQEEANGERSIVRAMVWDGKSWGYDGVFCNQACGYAFGKIAYNMIQAGELRAVEAERKSA